MLSKHLISSVLTQIPVFILGVISGVFSTRILGDEAKGAFTLFQANAQLFVLIFSLGIQTGIVYFISSKKINEKQIVGMTWFIFIASALLLLILLLFIKFFDLTFIFLPENYSTTFYLGILFCMYLLSFMNSLFSAFFQAHSDFKIINQIALLNSIINVVVFSALFYVIRNNSYENQWRLNLILITTLSVLLLNSLLWLLYYRKRINVQPDFTFEFKNQFKTFLLYNSSIYFGMFVNFFNYRLDLWIVNHYLPEKDLSYYSLAANINQIILYLAVTIGSVMLPNLSSRSEEDRFAIFVRVSRICFIAFLFIISIACLVAGFIIPFMYGTQFSHTILPFRIILPGILFSCITQLFSIFIVSINRNMYNIIACSAGLVITLLMDITLIPAFGISGAAIATASSYFIIFVITYFFIISEVKKRTYNFFIPMPGDLKSVYNLLKK